LQSFLPYADFSKSASCLDRQRLGKQRVEAWQIHHALTIGSRWKCHPAVKMWQGYKSALVLYGIEICKEWIRRGYEDNMLERFSINCQKYAKYPYWLGKQSFHSAHRSILLAKNYEWYKQFEWKEKPAIKNSQNKWPYEWPK
jgi:hypothetical protein